MGGSPPSESAGKQLSNEYLAQISREQWSDYERRFMPYERTLKNELGGGAALKDVGFAKRAIPQAFEAQNGAMGRDLARLGVTASPEQQAAMDQTLGLQKQSALIAGTNAARQHGQDRDLAILSGGSAGISRNIGALTPR